ncbi:MAG: CapA family protein [Cystobacterineae bacterium]|nr:CapA family protein [Cystobacterineae bacterium]
MKKKTWVVWVVLTMSAAGCLVRAPAPYGPPDNIEEKTKVEPTKAATEPVSISIVCAGDVMTHTPQILAQYDSESDSYDFNNVFAYVKKYIKTADLAIFNLETTLGGKPYTGYPMFSAPDALVVALKTAGFHLAITANNHMADRGLKGLKRTLEVLRENGFWTVGSRQKAEHPSYVIANVKGVKVGVVAYTYASTDEEGALFVNGSVVSKELAALINYFRYKEIDEDLEKMKKTVFEARAAGADVVIAYFHWGEEYHLKAHERQKYIAENMINNAGIDMIFASHPHTLQEMVFIANKETGAQVPVYYSLGNFVSNQRVETLNKANSKYTEIGAMARVRVEYDMAEKKTVRIEADAMPTWVEKYKDGDKDVYAIIPLDEALDTNETLAASGHLQRAKKAREYADSILGIP